MEAVKGQGVEERDIQTAYFSVYPEMDYREGGSGEVVGYRASSSMNVTVQDITKVGDILTLLAEKGDDGLTEIKGFGLKALADTKRTLRARGYVLPGDEPPAEEETPEAA